MKKLRFILILRKYFSGSGCNWNTKDFTCLFPINITTVLLLISVVAGDLMLKK